VNENKPIKRNKSLQAISREHHDGLLLCWKIKSGLEKEVDLFRIKKYVDWFYQNHLMPHFMAEEDLIFPILGSQDQLIKKAIATHKNLKKLFTTKTDLTNVFNSIATDLAQHIRFEERELFNKIQQVATPTQLQEIERLHPQIAIDNYEDKFWEDK
jgi:iron-sulfur cluster repair protein YtfE (RIC family)